MRSFTLVVLLAMALVLAAFCPTTSAQSPGSNVTVYADNACTQVMLETLQVPLPSAPNSCVDLSGPGGNGSAIFWCTLSGGVNNMTLATWTANNVCGGAAYLSVVAYGKDGGCVPATLTFSGQAIPCFAKVQCTTSVDVVVDEAAVEAFNGQLVEAQRDAVLHSVKSHRRGRLLPHARKHE